VNETSNQVAEALLQEGVSYAFGITGSGQSLSVISELERNGVIYYDVAHEAAAAIMAGTVARRTGRPSVSVSIKGPGLANMLPGIAHNFFEANPAVSISETYGPSVPVSRQHKRMDQRALLRPLVKGIAGSGSTSDDIRDHIRLARAEIPGPVHIELAEGTTSEPLRPVAGQLASSDGLPPILRRIQGSRTPVVIVGALGTRRGWGHSLSDLRIPVFTTASAKGLVDENAAYAAGVYTGDGKEHSPEAKILPDADLVVCVGVRDTEILSPWKRETPVVGVDEVAGSVGFGFAHYHPCASDEEIAQVLEALATKEWGADIVQHSRAALRTRLARTSWQPFHCFEALQARPGAQTLVTDTGSFCTIAEHTWIGSEVRPYLGSGNGRFMGVSLPMAIAVALTDREHPVVCALGDGGMRTYPALLKLAIEEELRLCVILMRDSQYGSIACAAKAGQSINAVRITQPSWAATCAGMGLDAAIARNEDEFTAALGRWNGATPFFIEAVFDPDSYLTITEGLR
jgi:acetolactate synthase I/II/III large subunit